MPGRRGVIEPLPPPDPAAVAAAREAYGGVHTPHGVAKGDLAVLDALGIDAITSYLAAGHCALDVARTLGIRSQSVYWWLSVDGRRARWRAAQEVSADAIVDRAEYEIREAESPLDLAKARELAQHARWRARAFAPRRYGDRVDVSVDDRRTLTDDQIAARIAALLAAGAVDGEARDVTDVAQSVGEALRLPMGAEGPGSAPPAENRGPGEEEQGPPPDIETPSG